MNNPGTINTWSQKLCALMNKFRYVGISQQYRKLINAVISIKVINKFFKY